VSYRRRAKNVVCIQAEKRICAALKGLGPIEIVGGKNPAAKIGETGGKIFNASFLHGGNRVTGCADVDPVEMRQGVTGKQVSKKRPERGAE